jgi:DNA-binding transcriptional LysR family regulator
MLINRHLLRIFFAVSEQRSFWKAVRTLFVSQPTMSKALRKLERQLDVPLPETGPRGLRPGGDPDV